MCAVACPRVGYIPLSYPNNIKLYNEGAQRPNVKTDKSLYVPACSGHGRCRTLREAGLEFNGLLVYHINVVHCIYNYNMSA